MGWRFRKSIRIGPLRCNFSRSGMGVSWGIPGFRLGKSPDGRSYITFGFPGTGLYYMKYFGRKRRG